MRANSSGRQIVFRKTFTKQFDKLPEKTRRQTMERIRAFQNNEHLERLHDHALTGRYRGYCSINITGDVRALYYETDGAVVIFAFIGSHSQLYGK